MLFSPPSPFCKNDGMRSTCKFINFVCKWLFSLCISCLTHPLFHFCHFFENQLPALVGEYDFESCINAKSCQNEFLRPSQGLHLFWNCLWHLEFAKSVRKKCISRLCALFRSSVRPYVFYRMHFA